MKALIRIVTVLTAALMFCALTGCMGITSTYDHADEYTSGGREISGEVTALDIDWSAGSVSVSAYDGSTVSIAETCSDDLSEDQKVHTWLDGTVLRVRYCRSGETFMMSSPDKKLEIKVPRSAKLRSIDHNGSSTDTDFSSMTAESIKVDLSSGEARLKDCSAKIFELDSSSGDITLDQKGESEKIKAEASSGKIKITAETVGELKLDTSSGDKEISVQKADHILSDSSSGSTELRLGTMPADMSIEASSGDVTLYIPADADFKGVIDTSSGDISFDLPLSNSGDTYTCGSGTNSLNIETSSGDISLRKA
ncbi:MAG: DUF4097 family beta strand repeat protein [Ruminococcus sp.]|nr:DUF4097 family beta strand repeat protein [Ruminococcus sp.]